MKVEQQQLYLTSELRELLREEAKATTRGNVSQLAEELIREGLERRILKNKDTKDNYEKLMSAVKNARQI